MSRNKQPLEASVEDHLVARVTTLGGETRKVSWVGRRHAPDRFVLLPGVSFWAELKRPKVGAEDGQLREHERIRKAGGLVLVLDTKVMVDRALKIITDYEALKRGEVSE